MRLLFLLSFVILGCESGTSRLVDLTVPSSVSSAFSASSPGLVVAELGESTDVYFVLCGQTPTNPLKLIQDFEFSCVGQKVGTTETARVWVQPLPSGWDAGFACAQGSQVQKHYHQLHVEPAAVDAGVDGGVVDAGVLATAPEATWPQGTDEGTWRRDATPCGGGVNFDITLAVP